MGTRLRDIATGGRRDVMGIDPKLIKIEENFNPRKYTLFENRDHLDDLKRSIAEVGVITPLLVRWDGEQAVLIDGECRLRACLELIKEGVEIASVPVLQQAGDEAQRIVIALTANTGKRLTVLESGGAYKRLAAFGWGIEQIAQKVGVSARSVHEAIELLDSPIQVKEMVSKGEVTPSLARQVVRQKGDRAAATLIEKVSKAKAAGKKTATREKTDGKVASAKKVEQVLMEEERCLGDDMADAITAYIDEQDGPLWRAAKRWNKLRGRE